MSNLSKKKISARLAVQFIFFGLIALIAVNHTLVESGKEIPFLSSASLHGLCPFGGVVSIYQLATVGTFVQKIHESSFVLMSIVLFLSILFGPVFCGWICPLGSIQEWIGKIGRKIFKKRFNTFIPYKFDKYLRYLRYGVMAWVIYVTAHSGKLFFSNIDPYNALFNFWSSEVAIGGVIVLVVTLTASLFVERPWCKYTCPFGAILGITNLFRVFKIRRNSSTCVSCNACNKACPMNINVSKKNVISNHQCISCMKCTSEAACPVSDTVELSVGGVK
ncbi:4Fe-4S binding protein [Brassicibacter mesophilus]|uniref:4Fe-4S binding protein n=1 Tax=Brassicibacter mesophilus TaxID=745119 RepID=UPI003D211158